MDGEGICGIFGSEMVREVLVGARGREGESALHVVGLPGDGDAEADVEWMVEAKRDAGAVLDGHQSLADEPRDATKVPFDYDVSDLRVGEDAKDVGRRVANGAGLGGVGRNSYPHHDGAQVRVPVAFDDGEAHRMHR